MDITWLNEDNWTQGAMARNSVGEEIDPNSPLAEKYDLFGALRVSYFDDEKFWEAIDKIKTTYRIVYKMKYAACVKEKYYKKEGKLIYCSPSISDLNDELDNFDQVKKLLVMSI